MKVTYNKEVRHNYYQCYNNENIILLVIIVTLTFSFFLVFFFLKRIVTPIFKTYIFSSRTHINFRNIPK